MANVKKILKTGVLIVGGAALVTLKVISLTGCDNDTTGGSGSSGNGGRVEALDCLAFVAFYSFFVRLCGHI